MANLPISVLPNVLASGVTPNDLLIIVNSGETKNIKTFDFQTYINNQEITSIGGPIGEQVIVPNSGVETIIYSFRVPANFWKAGQLFIPPYVAFQFQVLPENAPGEISNNFSAIDFNYPGNPNSFPTGYGNSTLTFSQASTTGTGNGVQIQIQFNSGNINSFSILNGGSGYFYNDIITTNNLGFGSLSFRVNEIFPLDTTYTFYLGSSENDISNTALYQETIQDGSGVFSAPIYFNGFSTVSGFGVGSGTKITDNTTLVYTTFEYNPIYNLSQLKINTTTIPDITQDIWITITAETQVNNLPIDLFWVGTTNSSILFNAYT
jgi:hypothetical protein